MYKIIILIIIISNCINSQLLKIPLIVSDGGANGTDTLFFGVDPTATEGIDTLLGEYQLPPVPPSGVFDCRFIGTDITPPLPFGQGLNNDYRYGNEAFSGSKLHEIKFQKGSGYIINIHWSLPNGVTGRLFDLFGGIVLYDSMYGTGNINISNNGINKLFMRVNYAFGSIGIKLISQIIPEDYILYQNYPNPFNPITKIRFSITKQEFVKLEIYDPAGKIIAVLVNHSLMPSVYEVNWNAVSTSSGLYFCKLAAGNYISVKKLMVLK